MRGAVLCTAIEFTAILQRHNGPLIVETAERVRAICRDAHFIFDWQQLRTGAADVRCSIARREQQQLRTRPGGKRVATASASIKLIRAKLIS